MLSNSTRNDGYLLWALHHLLLLNPNKNPHRKCFHFRFYEGECWDQWHSLSCPGSDSLSAATWGGRSGLRDARTLQGLPCGQTPIASPSSPVLLPFFCSQMRLSDIFIPSPSILEALHPRDLPIPFGQRLVSSTLISAVTGKVTAQSPCEWHSNCYLQLLCASWWLWSLRRVLGCRASFPVLGRMPFPSSEISTQPRRGHSLLIKTRCSHRPGTMRPAPSEAKQVFQG